MRSLERGAATSPAAADRGEPIRSQRGRASGDSPAGSTIGRVITRGIREFVARDWAAVRESKDGYWGARIAHLGPAEAFRVGEALRQQARLHAPLWPDAASRHDDLCAHVRLTELFRRAYPVRRA